MASSKEKSVLNVEVSCFKSHASTTPSNMCLLTILQSSRFRNQVEALRKMEDIKQRNQAKRLIPAFTPSGVFAVRSANALIQHSGLIQFDIDFKDNCHIPNYDCLKQQISNLSCVAYCGLSVSATGYWGLIPILYPEKHKEHFIALQQMFKSIGITIDASCKDVSRLRYYSWDDQAYLNHNAKIFFRTSKLVSPAQFRLPMKKFKGKNNKNDVENCISEIESRSIDITVGNENWFSIGCSLANKFGETGRDYFHRISQFNSDYTNQETDRLYSRCLKESYNYSIGTFYHFCKQAGISVKQFL